MVDGNLTLRAGVKMEYTMVELQIIMAILCVAGCGWTSWKLGHRAGILHTVTYLESKGVIEFEEGESSP